MMKQRVRHAAAAGFRVRVILFVFVSSPILVFALFCLASTDADSKFGPDKQTKQRLNNVAKTPVTNATSVSDDQLLLLLLLLLLLFKF